MFKKIQPKTKSIRRRNSSHNEDDDYTEERILHDKVVPETDASTETMDPNSFMGKENPEPSSSLSSSSSRLPSEEESLLPKIQSIKQKRRLLQQTMIHGGTSYHRKSHTNGTSNIEKEEEEEKRFQEANQDFRQRLEGTFAHRGKGHHEQVGTYPENHSSTNYEDPDDDGNGGGVLRQKHRLAMEEFIAQRLNQKSQSSLQPMETPIQENENSTIVTNIKLDTWIQSQKEADVGFGGAVLGGTGIAEVILPVNDRIRAIQDTEKAVAQNFMIRPSYPTISTGISGGADTRKTSEHLLPTSFHEGPGKKRKHVQEDISNIDIAGKSSVPNISSIVNSLNVTSGLLHLSASSAGTNVRPEDVSNLGSSYSHNFRLHNQEWINNKREQEEKELEAEKRKHALENTCEADQTRIGFDARKKQYGTGDRTYDSVHSAGKSNYRSNDDRTWKNFVTRTRDKR